MTRMDVILQLLWLQGTVLGICHTWVVRMPARIHGLQGSCLVIPCRYDYSSNPPRDPNRIVWYQYDGWHYPLVFDALNQHNVIHKFHGKTWLYGSPSSRQCSLKIDPVEQAHHGETVYTWVDPDHIGKNTYRFFDTTVRIFVDVSAKKPKLELAGKAEVGKMVRLTCRVEHTCPPHPPELSISGPEGTDVWQDRQKQEGVWESSVSRTWTVRRREERLSCTVRHRGGQTAYTQMQITSDCSNGKVTINPKAEVFLEGVEKSVTCSITSTCTKEPPTLSWNVHHTSVTNTATLDSGLLYTQSVLTFMPSADDLGQTFTCTARFPSGEKDQDSIKLQVKRSMFSLGWSVTIPKMMTGVRGSCLLIPCQFEFGSSAPPQVEVLWYLYSVEEYQLVFSQKQPGKVVSRYSTNTQLYNPEARVGDCSLEISSLEQLHHGDRLFVWVDQHPITAYHGLNFLDKAVELCVAENPDKPEISIDEDPQLGQNVHVRCSVYHSCPRVPPHLQLEGSFGNDTVEHTSQDDVWKTTVERVWMVKEPDQAVVCTVTYRGGQKLAANIHVHTECSIQSVEVTPKAAEFVEGMETNVSCTVSYNCHKAELSISWNYKDMEKRSSVANTGGFHWESISNLTFIASMEDSGKMLLCTGQLPNGMRSEGGLQLRVTKFQPGEMKIANEQDAQSTVLGTAFVLSRISALRGSCVVVPCRFDTGIQFQSARLRGIWQDRNGGNIYHNSPSEVVLSFRGRTRIVGQVEEQNCTLEIDEVKSRDNGPFCFHAEQERQKLIFSDSCVFVLMKASPNQPLMSTLPAEVSEDKPITVTCSVNHTCPSHPPHITWGVPGLKTSESHREVGDGVWETTSMVVFVPPGEEDSLSLTCNVTFWRGKWHSATQRLSVIRNARVFAVLLPVSITLLLIIAVVLAVIVWRKSDCRKSASGLQEAPARPEKRRSIWNRFSWGSPETRVQWVNETFPDYSRPPGPGTRRSFWNSFSRRNDAARQDKPARPEKRRSIWHRSRPAEANSGVCYSKHTPPARSAQLYCNPQTLLMEDGNVYGNMLR